MSNGRSYSHWKFGITIILLCINNTFIQTTHTTENSHFSDLENELDIEIETKEKITTKERIKNNYYNFGEYLGKKYVSWAQVIRKIWEKDKIWPYFIWQSLKYDNTNPLMRTNKLYYTTDSLAASIIEKMTNAYEFGVINKANPFPYFIKLSDVIISANNHQEFLLVRQKEDEPPKDQADDKNMKIHSYEQSATLFGIDKNLSNTVLTLGQSVIGLKGISRDYNQVSFGILVLIKLTMKQNETSGMQPISYWLSWKNDTIFLSPGARLYFSFQQASKPVEYNSLISLNQDSVINRNKRGFSFSLFRIALDFFPAFSYSSIYSLKKTHVVFSLGIINPIKAAILHINNPLNWKSNMVIIPFLLAI